VACDPGMPQPTRLLTPATILASGRTNPWPLAIRKISGLPAFTCVTADHPLSVGLRTIRYLLIRPLLFRPVGYPLAGQDWLPAELHQLSWRTVRFAPFTPRPSHAPHDNCPCPYTPVIPSLALFCTFRLRHRPAAGIFQSAILGPGPKLGSFCTFHSPGRSTARTTIFAHIPQSLQVWLRFAQFTSSSACGGGEIGFVLRILPPATAPGRRLSTRNPGSSDPQNWVRFARFTPGRATSHTTAFAHIS
jgi:hypothetical protein